MLCQNLTKMVMVHSLQMFYSSFLPNVSETWCAFVAKPLKHENGNGVMHACTQAGDIERAEMYLNGMDVRLCAGYVPLSLRMWDLFRDSLEC